MRLCMIVMEKIVEVEETHLVVDKVSGLTSMLC